MLNFFIILLVYRSKLRCWDTADFRMRTSPNSELNYKSGNSILSVLSPQVFLYAKLNPSHYLGDAAFVAKRLFSSAIT